MVIDGPIALYLNGGRQKGIGRPEPVKQGHESPTRQRPLKRMAALPTKGAHQSKSAGYRAIETCKEGDPRKSLPTVDSTASVLLDKW
jgi:hypothetical protein